MNDAARMARRAAGARAVTLAVFGVLLLTIAIDVLGRAELDAKARAVLWMMQTVPLVVFLPGLLRGAWKTYLWLCFVLLIYFLIMMNRLFSPQGGALEVCQILATGLLFTAATLFARWRQRELAAAHD